MSKPLITFYCAARRAYRYRPFYDSITYKTSTPFEIIFVGPTPPTQPMPNNFHYIKTEVKPSQCYEIAVRNASGFFVQPVADDATFDVGFVDTLVNYTEILDIDKVLMSVRLRLMTKPPKFIMHDRGTVYNKAIDAPFAGCAPLFRRDIWHKLGGIDRRLMGTMTDLDMQMRFYEYGMVPFYTPDCIMSEHNFYDRETRNDSLLIRTWNDTWEFLDRCWMQDGHFSKKRLIPVQSFSNDRILERDQN